MPTGEVQTCGFMAALCEPGFGWAHRESISALWHHIRQRAPNAPASCSTAPAATSVDLLQISSGQC
jgi:hypothetical protein